MKPSRRQMIRVVLSHAGMAAGGLGLLLSASMVSGSPVSGSPRAQAQSEVVGADTVVRVANTDGQPLDLRSGPSADQPIVASLTPDEMLTVIGAAETVGTTRWLPVRTAANQLGWVSDQYVVVVSQPASIPSPTPDLSLAELPTPPSTSSPMPLTPSEQQATPVEASPPPGRPVEIEAKVKYPEAKGRHQEITIWVTREGAPVQGAIVTVFTESDEDEPVRVLEPTNVYGRTRREFAIGREKGSIELVVSVVAPDGGEGRTSVSYFRR